MMKQNHKICNAFRRHQPTHPYQFISAPSQLKQTEVNKHASQGYATMFAKVQLQNFKVCLDHFWKLALLTLPIGRMSVLRNLE